MEDTNSNKIAVIGGSGRAGSSVVNQLFQSGYCIRLLMRNGHKLKIIDERIEVVDGDARDIESIKSLLQGCNTVISTLGQPRGEKPIFSAATQNIVAAMNEYNIRRYIFVSGVGVNAPNDKKEIKDKMMSLIMKLIFPAIMSDKQNQLEILLKSNLDWTLVRVPLIVDTSSLGETKILLEHSLGKKISNTALADFLIKQISDTNYIKKCPFVSN